MTQMHDDVEDAVEAPRTALQPAENASVAPAPVPSSLNALSAQALLDPIGHKVTFEELWRFAGALSRSEIVPWALQGKPANVFAVIMRGLELGITPMTAVCEINVIGGKTSLSSALMVARVLQSGKAAELRLVETSDEVAVVRVRRTEWTEARDVEFNMAEAKKLGLDKPRGKNGAPSPYVTQPANMLRRRAFARACREHFPDVIIAYDPDELVGEVEMQGAPSSSWSAPPPAAPAPATPPVDAAAQARMAEVRERAAANANAPSTTATPSQPSPPPPAEPPVDKTMAPSTVEDATRDPDQELALAVIADLTNAKSRDDVDAAGRRSKPLRDKADAGDTNAKALYDEVVAMYRAAGKKFPKQQKAAGK